ncbi:hypothetical protein Taro_003272 [Colocasia esculenta]|uniref:Aminotransferase-like plant mobile domain-containing protein n=1 Tax=Colocasia esculenta TaxID=4460 RepID=A0A843TLG9_COLES|nr:hypothetical protein [Colocasia esculenta]
MDGAAALSELTEEVEEDRAPLASLRYVEWWMALRTPRASSRRSGKASSWGSHGKNPARLRQDWAQSAHRFSTCERDRGVCRVLNATALVVAFLLPPLSVDICISAKCRTLGGLLTSGVGRRRPPTSRSSRDVGLRRVLNRCAIFKNPGRTELPQALLDQGGAAAGFPGDLRSWWSSRRVLAARTSCGAGETPGVRVLREGVIRGVPPGLGFAPVKATDLAITTRSRQADPVVVRRLFRNASLVGYPKFFVSQARVFVVLGVCLVACSALVVGGMDTSRRTEPQLVLLPVPHFRELGPESLKVPGMGLQCVRLQGFLTKVCPGAGTVVVMVVMKRSFSASQEDIPPYSGPKAAKESHADLQQRSAIPGHICMCPELQTPCPSISPQILPGQRRFSRVPWLAPILELLLPSSISHLKEWGLSTVFVLAKSYDKIVHMWDSVTALAELWHTQTHTFVFPTFEATILLEELEIMLGLPQYQRGEELAISYTVAPINSWSILEEITMKKTDLHSMTSGMHVHLLPIVQWITSQCKCKTENCTAIAKGAVICICGVILFPAMDGAISFANLNIIASISEGMSIGQAALGYLYAGLTSAATGGPFYGSIIALELWMGMHIQFRAMENLATECKTMLHHPLAFMGGPLRMSTKAWCKTTQLKGLKAWRDYFKRMTIGGARTVVPFLSHFPPIQERKRGDEQDELDVRSAIVHWEGCALGLLQAEVEEDEDVTKEYLEALKKIQPTAGVI